MAIVWYINYYHDHSDDNDVTCLNFRFGQFWNHLWSSYPLMTNIHVSLINLLNNERWYPTNFKQMSWLIIFNPSDDDSVIWNETIFMFGPPDDWQEATFSCRNDWTEWKVDRWSKEKAYSWSNYDMDVIWCDMRWFSDDHKEYNAK